MRLLSITVDGFRRLAGVKLNVDEPITAIVGPNEAGKSTVLDCLLAMDNDHPIPQSDRTRGLKMDDSKVVIKFHYLLEGLDLELLRGIEEAREARYLVIEKRLDGSIGSDVRPHPVRNLQKRQKALRALERLHVSKGVVSALLENEELSENFDECRKALSSDEQSLEAVHLQSLTSLASTIKDDSWSASAHKLAGTLDELVAYEEVEHPRDVARRLMLARRPVSLLFGAEERDLRDAYSLDAVANDVPAALANLLAVADLDLGALVIATEQGDFAAKESLIREANQRLEAAFAESWQQSSVSVQLGIEDRTLRVFASGEGRRVTSVAERSEGLRTFIALLCFMAARDVAFPPVLLIDEAEQHLHYDAQADLIRMLGRQIAATQVIYTTHSAGCLPQDLAAVRVVAPGPTAERSVARNAFWESDSAGFDSLLFAMGASTFAFAATRRAVIGEGPTEVVLLPRLLREASGLRDPGFQVAPGLATVDQVGAKALDLVAVRVAYLVDDDAGGRANAKVLKKAGVPEDRIAYVRLKGAQDTTVEDLVEAGAYLRAVNEELRRSHGDACALKASDIPAYGRCLACEDACARLGVSAPNKVAVARRLVAIESDVRLLSGPGKKATIALYEQLLAILDIK